MKKRFLAPVLFCASITCQAGDYVFQPVFSSSEQYHSNLFMSQKPRQDNWITTLSPGVNLGLHGENKRFNSNFTWNSLLYNNQSELNINEQLFNVDYQHKLDRFELAFNGYFNNRSSLNTIGTVNGLTFTQVMSKQLNLSPSVTYDLDERSSASFDYSYNKTSYDKNQNSFLTDYEYHQASGTFNHQYTEHDKLNVTLSSSLYQSQGKPLKLIPDTTTYNHVAMLGWQHSFSKELLAYVSMGINYAQADTKSLDPQLLFLGFNSQRVPVFYDFLNRTPTIQQRYQTVSRTDFGQVYRASIQKSFEKGSASVTASQNQTPTSQGLQTQTQLIFNNAYTINDRWTTGFSASYSNYEVTGQKNNSNNRTFYSIGPNIYWKWTSEINLALSYTYRQQKFQGSNQPSDDNNLQLQFTYQPQTNYQVK